MFLLNNESFNDESLRRHVFRYVHLYLYGIVYKPPHSIFPKNVQQ